MPAEEELFADRRDAGRALADCLVHSWSGRPLQDVIVLGLPRGGVVVAAEVAQVLGAPLDLLVVRKLGVPGAPELAMGAIAAAGKRVETVRVAEVLRSAGVGEDGFAAVREVELRELRRREAAYREGRQQPDLRGRQVLLVDDGLATGATMGAAVAAVRGVADGVAVAVPAGSPRAVARLRPEVDDLVCLRAPQDFTSLGRLYRDFAATSDDEVRAALRAATQPPA